MTETKCPIALGEGAPLHPWYKESLRTKCLKDPVRKQRLSGALDGRGWRLLRPGQDDFRDGYPALRGEPLTQPQRGTGPPVLGLVNRARPATSPKKRFTKEQACFSRLSCLRHARRQYVEAVEQKLSAHPLALYPHLTSGLQPELINDVLSVLDPEMHVKRESDHSCFWNEEECSEEAGRKCESPTQEPSMKETTKTSAGTKPLMEGVKDSDSRNPFKWQEPKDTRAKEDQMVSDKFLHSPSQDEDIKKVTKLFCDWVTSLGGETNSLTESTILSLFFSGYEKKPALMFPVQVLGPNQIPEELQTTVECLCKDYSRSPQLKELNKVCTPSVKTANDAWYLDPKTWKKQPANKPLRDPSVSKDLEHEQHPTEKDELLKQIHGTQAFRQFIISKGLRMPRFISSLFLEEEQKNRTTGTDTIASASMHKGTAML
ncbi:hypothetical protein AOLI_G00279670 [Acnodon oligacanthus]